MLHGSFGSVKRTWQQPLKVQLWQCPQLTHWSHGSPSPVQIPLPRQLMQAPSDPCSTIITSIRVMVGRSSIALEIAGEMWLILNYLCNYEVFYSPQFNCS